MLYNSMEHYLPLLEAKRKHTICRAAGDGLTRQKQRG